MIVDSITACPTALLLNPWLTGINRCFTIYLLYLFMFQHKKISAFSPLTGGTCHCLLDGSGQEWIIFCGYVSLYWATHITGQFQVSIEHFHFQVPPILTPCAFSHRLNFLHSMKQKYPDDHGLMIVTGFQWLLEAVPRRQSRWVRGSGLHHVTNMLGHFLVRFLKSGRIQPRLQVVTTPFQVPSSWRQGWPLAAVISLPRHVPDIHSQEGRKISSIKAYPKLRLTQINKDRPEVAAGREDQ